MTKKEYWHLYRSCLSKVIYETAESAAGALRSMLMRGRKAKRGHDLHTYRCEACQKWHLGNISRGTYRERVTPLYREIADGQRDWWPLHEAYITMDRDAARRVAADAAHKTAYKKALPDLSDNSVDDQFKRLPASHRL